MKPIKITFDENMDMWHGGRYGNIDPSFTIIEFTEGFDDIMTFESFYCYSTTIARFRNQKGQLLWMSLGEFEKSLPSMKYGRLEGKFFFKKHGNYFSLIYLDDQS